MPGGTCNCHKPFELVVTENVSPVMPVPVKVTCPLSGSGRAPIGPPTRSSLPVTVAEGPGLPPVASLTKPTPMPMTTSTVTVR